MIAREPTVIKVGVSTPALGFPLLPTGGGLAHHREDSDSRSYKHRFSSIDLQLNAIRAKPDPIITQLFFSCIVEKYQLCVSMDGLWQRKV